MKKVIVILSFLLSGTMLLAQSKNYEAPDRVRESFNKEYPKAEKTHWAKSGNQWSASFQDQEHGEMVAHFGKNGDHIDSRIPFSERDVPGPVKDKIKQSYPKGRDHEYTKIERNHGNDQFYKVHLRDHGHDRTVYMDAQGHKRSY
jgi:hypothetical protein